MTTVSAPRPNSYDDPAFAELLGKLDHRLLSSLLIAREAEGAGATVEWLSSDTFLATSGGRDLLFKANRCTESVPAARTVRDKGLVKKLLGYASVKTPRGGVADSLAAAMGVYATLHPPVVVKPARGDRGSNVTVGVTDDKHLERAYRQASRMGQVLIEEFIPGTEFRCLATTDECVGVIARDAPNVIGDARHTIAELVERKNAVRKRNPGLQGRSIVVDDQAVAYLARSGLTLGSVPEAGAKVYLGGAANITVGGDSISRGDDAPDVVRRTAVEAVRAIPGMHWAGVDIILADQVQAAEVSGTAAFVLEINVNAGISSFHYPVYGSPSNIAARIWRTRLESTGKPAGGRESAPGSQSGSTPRVPSRPLPMAQVAGAAPRSGNLDLVALLAARAEALGADTERLGSQLLLVRHRADRHLYHGCCGAGDLTIVSQVLRRRAIQRRLLRRGGVRVVAGRTARSIDDAVTFVNDAADQVALLPARGGPDGVVLATVDPGDVVAVREAWSQTDGAPVFLQVRPAGPKLRVFATRQASTMVLCDRETVRAARPGGRDVKLAEELAIRAVGAIPELRWAAVDVTLARTEVGRTRPVVTGMTTEPRIRTTDHLVAGGPDRFLEMILPPELVGGRPSELPSEQERLGRPGRWWRSMRRMSLSSRRVN
jgi:D-alanine-D-alanine ligase-like ATP-grasp enzyme